MKRRSFLRVLATAALGVPRLGRGRQGHEEIRVLVAGVRYSSAEALSRAQPGERVELRRASFRGSTAYAIYAGTRKIGFVPRTALPAMEGKRVSNAYVSRSDTHAVPWKRLEVTIVLADRDLPVLGGR
jgi:hypothetical protein